MVLYVINKDIVYGSLRQEQHLCEFCDNNFHLFALVKANILDYKFFSFFY